MDRHSIGSFGLILVSRTIDSPEKSVADYPIRTECFCTLPTSMYIHHRPWKKIPTGIDRTAASGQLTWDGFVAVAVGDQACNAHQNARAALAVKAVEAARSRAGLGNQTSPIAGIVGVMRLSDLAGVGLQQCVQTIPEEVGRSRTVDRLLAQSVGRVLVNLIYTR